MAESTSTARIRLALDGASAVEQGLAAVQSRIGGVGKSLAGLAGGLTVGAFAAFVKSSINAADEMSKLSQKAGVAVEQVAGLQLAFRQSGLEAGDLQANLGKLNKNIADGSVAFSAMGLSVKNADGSLKSTRQVLGEVADKFASYEDGAAKARLAQELFGKSGAAMIPLLNGGAQALDEFDSMARKLGLTMDENTAKQAEKFNDTLDLVGQGVQGVGRQIAAQLLPTLSGLAGQFFESMTQGDRLKKVADFLATGLKGLYVVALGVVEAFNSVGKAFGGVFAAVVAASQGDFRLAGNILREMRADITSGWSSTLEDIKKAWNATGNAAIESMAATTGALKRAAPDLKAAEKAAEAAAKAAEDFIKLRDKINGKQTGTDPDFLKNMQLLATEGKKLGLSLEEIIRLQEAYIEMQPYMQEQIKAAAKEQEEANRVNADAIEAAYRQATGLQEQVERQREYVAAIGLTKDAVAALEAAKLEEQATSKDRLATLADEIDWTGQLGDSYRAQAAALRELASLKRQGAAKEIMVEEARKAAEEWQKFTDQVNQSLTDSLMRAFESGGNFFKTFWRSIVNTLKTSVLKVLIQPVVGGITGAFGLTGTASAGQGGGVLGGSLNLLSIGDTISKVYTTITGGFAALGDKVAFAAQDVGAWLVQNTTGVLNSAGSSIMQASQALGTVASYAGGILAGYGLGKAISGQYTTALGKNTMEVAGTTIGAIVGGPLGAAIGGAIGGLVNRAFGMGAKQITGEGLSGTFSASSGASVSSYSSWFQKGGWFRSNKSGTNYSAISTELDQFLDVALMMTTNATKEYARLLGLNAEAISGFSKSINISLMGLDQAGKEKAIANAISSFGNDMAQLLLGSFTQVADPRSGIFGKLMDRLFGLRFKTTWNPGEFVRDGESAAEALSRLATSLASVNDVLKSLRQGQFVASLRSGDAASQLLDLFGGIDNYAKAASAYLQSFYSDAERIAIAQDRLTEAMNTIGLSLPSSIAGYRQLVEAQDLAEEGGRATYVALLQLAPAFAELNAALTGTVETVALATDGIFGEIRRLRRLLVPAGAGSLASLQADFAMTTAAARAGDQAALDRLPSITQALESAAALQAITSADLARLRGQLSASLEATLEALGIQVPQFDIGTNYVPKDMLAVVHEGEAIVPRAYNPAAGGASATDTQRMELQMERLAAELQGLRAEVRAGVAHTAKTARILERVTDAAGTAINTIVETA